MNDAGQGPSASGSWQPDPTGRHKLRWRNEAGNWTDHVYSSEGEISNDPYDSGSWQPDPTGRFRLRWQRGTGEWTDHVYSSEGELGNDSYGASPAPIQTGPPQPPTGSEMPGLETVSNPDSQKPPRRRRRKLLIALGIVIGLFITLGIIGSFVPDPETTSTEPSPPATTAHAETTRGTTTTTARHTTTSQSLASTEEDCAVRSSLLGILSGEVGGLFEELQLQAAIGDIVGMQETYGTIAWSMADLPDMARETIEICRPHVPPSALDDIESSLAVAEAGWREMQRACRSDLAPLGFNCDTGTMEYSATASSGADADAASGLTARETTCADNWETISYSEMLRMKRDRSIDGIYDWSGGYWVSYEKIMDIC